MAKHVNTGKRVKKWFLLRQDFDAAMKPTIEKLKKKKGKENITQSEVMETAIGEYCEKIIGVKAMRIITVAHEKANGIKYLDDAKA